MGLSPPSNGTRLVIEMGRFLSLAAGLLDADLEAIVCVLVPKQKCVFFLRKWTIMP